MTVWKQPVYLWEISVSHQFRSNQIKEDKNQPSPSSKQQDNLTIVNNLIKPVKGIPFRQGWMSSALLRVDGY